MRWPCYACSVRRTSAVTRDELSQAFRGGVDTEAGDEQLDGLPQAAAKDGGIGGQREVLVVLSRSRTAATDKRRMRCGSGPGCPGADRLPSTEHSIPTSFLSVEPVA